MAWKNVNKEEQKKKKTGNKWQPSIYYTTVNFFKFNLSEENEVEKKWNFVLLPKQWLRLRFSYIQYKCC